MKLLDLFCGAGGASMGYHQAGFTDIVGVDINPMPMYPFTFYQDDALDFVRRYGRKFDVIHASPPCQHYSTLNRGMLNNHGDHPNLVDATRAALIASGKTYIIENVPGAPLINPIMLCGEMFGLGVIKHRRFESNAELEQPEHIKHRGNTNRHRHGTRTTGPYFGVYGNGGGFEGSVADWQEAMGIDWITKRKPLAQAIPPAYTRYIGGQIMR